LKVLANVSGNQFTKHFLKVFMYDSSPSGPHLGDARGSVLMDVLEYGKAEPDNSFVPLSRGWKIRRVNRLKHVMYAADKQLVLVAKVRVKS
jgi:hypothetical protein